MSTLPTRAIAHAYITEHGLQNILNRAVNACVHAKATDPIGFIIEHLKAVKEAATSNTTVAQEKEEKNEDATTTALVPAVTSEFDGVLLEAARKGDFAKVEALLAKGADVKAVSKDMYQEGMTPLHRAALNGHTAIVDTLLAHGADAKAVDSFGRTPLHFAAMEGRTATVDALLKAGADGTAKDNSGKSPAEWAKNAKHPMIAAKCDPAFAKVEGEKLKKAFEEATTVHVLSTRFNEPSEEAVAAWCKANGIKKKNIYTDEELSLIHI